MAIPQHYPEELLHIRCLLVQKQYHQCIKACVDVLSTCEKDTTNVHPLAETFATFYLALAHDELARSMHEQSSFKLPTFTRAEQHYRQAIRILPSAEQCRSVLAQAEAEPSNAINVPAQSPNPKTTIEQSAKRPESPPPKTPPRPPALCKTTNNENNPPDSPKESDFSDTESHDSFDDIMTPHRILKRDVSRMSLLDRPLQRHYSSMSLLDTRPALSKSVSQGLLRPIRPGSPPKQYHLPPKLPYSGQSLYHINVPKLRLSPPRSPPLANAPTTLAKSRQPVPQTTSSPAGSPHSRPHHGNESPVSSLDSDILDIEGSVTSPVSPQTPPGEAQQSTTRPTTAEAVLEDKMSASSLDLTRLTEHLSAMRTQIQTHTTLLQRAKLATTVAQAERASRSTMSANARLDGGVFGRGPAMASPAARRIPQSKSFWSFTPVDVQAAERKKRIEEGRARGWERKRYTSEKYVALAEKALAEL